MKLFTTVAATLLFATVAPLRADEATHRASAETLLSAMDMENMMVQSIDQMLQMQIKQNPAIAQFEPQMRAFLSKYMSWAGMKEEMVKLYVTEFTESELKELVAFYQTPVGKKAIQKMPALMAKGAEIGQKKVQEHMPELQASIQAAVEAKK